MGNWLRGIGSTVTQPLDDTTTGASERRVFIVCSIKETPHYGQEGLETPAITRQYVQRRAF